MTSSNRPVRVRLAPSPTGDPHIGTAYMALFNYVFAKRTGGKFIIRIEDTDQTRYRSDSERMILECLHWLGLTWDEGPDIGGPHMPYHQSQRTELYRKEVQNLLDKGHAYRCFCTPQRLDEMKKSQMAQKLPPGYDRRCRNLLPEDIEKFMQEGLPYTVRMKMPVTGKTVFRDGLRGNIEFDNETIDDQILMKSDGFPTYHLANVVDDHHMEITHVIRGEEWISSTPKHVVLYDMFGWEKPEFYHMPLLRNADKSKVSKRKNPVSVNYYRRKGILPEALLNFLALMGWNLGENREIFSLQEMCEHFNWERMTLGGPVFDLQKLAWLNGQYMRKLEDDRYVRHLREEIFSDEYLRKILPLVKDRVEKFEDFVPYTEFFFSGDLTYEGQPLVVKGRTAADTANILNEVMDRLEAIEDWSTQPLHETLEAYNKEKGYKPKDSYMPLRVAVTGRKDSPPLFETMEVLGKEIVRRRVRLAIQYLLTLKEETSGAPAPAKK